jgi:hypothetical protein
MWAAISTWFHGKSIRIEISKEDPDMRKPFNITRIPSVLFMNGTGSKLYKGKIDFKSLKSAIENYFERTLKMDNEQTTESVFSCRRTSRRSAPAGGISAWFVSERRCTVLWTHWHCSARNIRRCGLSR